MGSADLEAFLIQARNLPEHANNPIHTDAGARAAGFPRGLVAGVTTYAYLTHPLAHAWGLEWLRCGGGEVRFRAPIFDGDDLRCEPKVDADGSVTIAGRVGEDERPRAELHAFADGGAVAKLRDGERLIPRDIRLEGEWGLDYGARAGDDLSLYRDHDVVHPAVWPALANFVVHRQVARGPWIHLRSVIRHHALAPAGAVATVSAVVVSRTPRGGERAIIDVHIEVDGVVVASLEHEAIVALTD